MEGRGSVEMRNDERRSIEYKIMKLAIYIRVSTEDQVREGHPVDLLALYLFLDLQSQIFR